MEHVSVFFAHKIVGVFLTPPKKEKYTTPVQNVETCAHVVVQKRSVHVCLSYACLTNGQSLVEEAQSHSIVSHCTFMCMYMYVCTLMCTYMYVCMVEEAQRHTCKFSSVCLLQMY
jgi:hypothetical protein